MKLTLAEIAARYRKTPKTFARHVKRLGIPHEMLGRSMLFDPVTVAAHLVAITVDETKVVKFPATVRKSQVKSKFAEAVRV